MAVSSSSSSFNHLLPLAHTHFFNDNELDDGYEFQQFLDTTFAEQLQLEEALNASYFTAQMTGQSSLGFCDLCNERKENDELNKSGKCDHSLCLDCSKLNKGNCPVLNCDYAPKSDKFKQFLPEDLLFLWEKAPKPSSDPIPKFNCREESHAMMDSKNPRSIVKMDGKSTMNRRKDNKAPKQAYKCINKTPSWKGLKEEKKDHEIVWPPMVVISYTMEENDKWIGMTNQEVINMFSSYDAIATARQFHNLETHCGTSVLIFESSFMGYLEAVRLHKHFLAEGAGRNAWDSKSCHFSSSEEKQLYGYLALKGDIDIFNYHTTGKNQLKYEMRSYQKMVVNLVKQMGEDDYQHCYGVLKDKLQIAKTELNVMRRKVEELHHRHMEEVECQEQFYKDQIRNILESRTENERDLKKAQDQENVEHFPNGILDNGNDHEYISEEITKPVKNQGKDREKGRKKRRNHKTGKESRQRQRKMEYLLEFYD